jgi:hypothetical protein
MFKCLVSCLGYFAKTVTSLLPQLTVLADVVCPELLQGTRSLKVP